jgi:hypothetical protein
MKRGIVLVAFALFVACGEDANTPTGTPEDAALSDAALGDSSWPDAGGSDAAEDVGVEASVEPCPTLPIPTTCFGREVMYREWGPNATGDGTYFADQAPYRLGFNRVQNRIWIVKFQVEENTYRARLSTSGDSPTTSGHTWISDQPCDAQFAIDNQLVTWGAHGGGMLLFNVVKNDADANTLKTDPKYLDQTPQLRGGHCYYLAFENLDGVPQSAITADYIATAGDNCGANGDGTCYYLAMDFLHYLHDITTGQVVAGNVIPGLTQ